MSEVKAPVFRAFVAGASSDIARFRAAEALLKGVDIQVYDWATPIETFAAEGKTDHDLDDATLAHYARLGLEAVAACHAYVLLTPESDSIGAWVELGIALALMKPVFAVVPGKRSLFKTLGTLVDCDIDAIKLVSQFRDSDEVWKQPGQRGAHERLNDMLIAMSGVQRKVTEQAIREHYRMIGGFRAVALQLQHRKLRDKLGTRP